MTEHEEITKILEDELVSIIEKLEKGESVLVRGGYVNHSYKDRTIDMHHQTLVSKLTALEYQYTSNHGHGCYDYHFTKPIKL